MGAAARIFGDVQMGESLKAAAGSVVLNDVPPHPTAAGLLAKIVVHPRTAEPALQMDPNIEHHSKNGQGLRGLSGPKPAGTESLSAIREVRGLHLFQPIDCVFKLTAFGSTPFPLLHFLWADAVRSVQNRPGQAQKERESFDAANPLDRDLGIPIGIPEEPLLSEPPGGVLGLLAALYEEDVRVVYARGGLTGFESVLQDQFCYLPYDVMIPGVPNAGDLCDVAAALAPRPVRLEGLVDGLNRRASLDAVESEYKPVRQAYARAAAPGKFDVGDPADDSTVAQWLLKSLSGR